MVFTEITLVDHRKEDFVKFEANLRNVEGMSPRQRRIRLSAALREPQHQPVPRADGNPARTQHRDREVFQLHSAEVSDR
jgi:hypothetical protein